MTLQVKKGDRVIIKDMRGCSECIVSSVGTKWITVGRSKYDRVSGCGEYGTHLYTPEGYEKHRRNEAAGHKLRKLGIDVHYGSPLRDHEDALLEAVLAIAPEMRAKVEDE